MMSFITFLLRVFVSIAIALCVIGGAAVGWFYEEIPVLAQRVATAGGSPAIQGIGAVVGGIVGLIVATLTFGVIATMLDMRDRLIEISRSLEAAPADRRPLNWEKP
ncbi:MAG: hypothetical protein QF893_11270 [Alphaproteobacteria bacterium]|jgi:hypothetical protein|nr:hypothetical protein [Alphaproteobacteria bacterium]